MGLANLHVSNLCIFTQRARNNRTRVSAYQNEFPAFSEKITNNTLKLGFLTWFYHEI